MPNQRWIWKQTHSLLNKALIYTRSHLRKVFRAINFSARQQTFQDKNDCAAEAPLCSLYK